MMGQAVRKIKRGTSPHTPADSQMTIDTSHVRREDIALTKDKSSESSPWITEVPTRSSSAYSDPTGYSSFVTTEETRLTDASSGQSLSTLDAVVSTRDKKQPPTFSDRTQGSSHSSSNNTSRDHPPLKRLDLNYADFSRQAKADQKWQEAVNVFLQHDPIIRTPKPKKHASYIIRRHYCFISRDVGYRWKKAVEKWQARKEFSSIPIASSECSEA